MMSYDNFAILNENPSSDKVSNVLKWVLLITAVICFAVVIWGTFKTYQLAPPLPQNFVTTSGKTIMTDNDIVMGKAGFQRADLMDYGSLYGMGSYFGEDYTAKYLVRLGRLTENEIARERFGKAFSDLSEGDQYVVRKNMQQSLQQIDLSSNRATLTNAVSKSIIQLQSEISQFLTKHDFESGYTKAYSLDSQSALQTADFLIYSSLTTIAHRPGKNFSYTNNWPYEPTMGNTPTPDTFYWTWVSFCFVFFGFGVVLYIYHRYLSGVDEGVRNSLFMDFKPLTPSQKKAGQYFLIASLVLLAQIAVGAIMAHYYTERTGFYGININAWLPINFLRDVHTQTQIVWIGISWISAAIFLATIISGKEAKWQGFLVDLLFWVTLFVVAGALIGNYLGIMGLTGENWFWVG
ncbi:MAG: nitric-oxide reductase large subunit, partial [Gammaproteobacteria bacterium]